MHQPGIEPGSHRWQRCILPLDHWCQCHSRNGQCCTHRMWNMLQKNDQRLPGLVANVTKLSVRLSGGFHSSHHWNSIMRPCIPESHNGSVICTMHIHTVSELPITDLWACHQTGYSSVGRASDCRVLQLSDGPWFDSGWPDFDCVLHTFHDHIFNR